MEAKVGDLEDEPGVDDAVGRLEVAVAAELGGVDESHALIFEQQQKSNQTKIWSL